ncbi:hypothetical protein Tco_1010943 [Tanacetum coccineum]
MGRDTIQLEDVVSTIFEEYLLEFTSEYGIPEGLHPELPGPEETIVDFSEEMDLFNLISAPNPARVKTGTRPRAAHEVPLLTVTGDGTEDQVLGELSCDIPPEENPTTTEVVPKLEKELVAMGTRVNKRHHKRGSDEADANAPPKVLRKDHATVRPEQSTRRGKSFASMGLEVGSTFITPATHEALAGAKSVSDLDSLSYAKPQLHLERDTAQMQVFQDPLRKDAHHGGARPVLYEESGVREIDLHPVRGRVARRYLSTGVGCDQQLPPGYPRRMPRRGRSHSAAGDHRIQVRKKEIKKLDHEVKSLRTVEVEVHGLRNRTKNLETLLEAEVDMKKTAEAKNAELVKELESLRAQFSGLKVNNNQLSQQVSTLQAQVTGEERIKASFKEFKKYEDDKVEQRCTEMDVRLDGLSIDFDEELYPHMLTTIAGRRWVIGHGLRLDVMKCGESMKLRQAFANVVSAGIAKGMSEGLKYGVKHGKAKLDLAAIEAYDPEADDKYMGRLSWI